MNSFDDSLRKARADADETRLNHEEHDNRQYSILQSTRNYRGSPIEDYMNPDGVEFLNAFLGRVELIYQDRGEYPGAEPIYYKQKRRGGLMWDSVESHSKRRFLVETVMRGIGYQMGQISFNGSNKTPLVLSPNREGAGPLTGRFRYLITPMTNPQSYGEGYAGLPRPDILHKPIVLEDRYKHLIDRLIRSS